MDCQAENCLPRGFYLLVKIDDLRLEFGILGENLKNKEGVLGLSGKFSLPPEFTSYTSHYPKPYPRIEDYSLKVSKRT